MRILYIDIDSLRPDHLGCYGYHRSASPHIDALSAEGVRFTQYHATDAPCLPSRTAMYSGRFGIQTGVVGHGGTAAQPKIQGAGRGWNDLFGEQGLAHKLQNLGFHTTMISPFGQRHSAHWIYAGFNEVHNTGRNGLESAEHIQPVVDQWLGANAASDNWFLHVNYWDPHTPYRVPLSYGEPFAAEPLPAWLDDEAVIHRHNRAVGPFTSLDLRFFGDREDPNFPRQPGKITDLASLRRVIDGYDTGIRYADDHVGRIISQLKDAGVWDDTAVIVSADHGESFGEMGIYGDHLTADVSICRVPLIIRWPGGQAGATEELFHSNVDFAPTITEMLGGEPSPLWDGQSFAASLTGQPSAGRDDLILSQCAHVCQRSVRWGDWLYLRTYHDGFHLYPQEMLFDIATDPHEQSDLAPSRPDLCREGAWRLTRWHDAQMEKMARVCTDVVDPLWTVIKEGGPFHARHAGPNSPLPAYLTRLQQTGRAEGATRLRTKYAAWL